MPSAPLRVGFCLHDSPDSLGGPYVWAQRLLPALNAEDLDLTALIVAPGASAEGCATALSLQKASVACRFCDFEQPIQDRVRWILEQCNALRLDVLVANFQVEAWYAARWLKRAGIAVVGVLHSDDPFYDALMRRSVCGARRWRVDAIVAVSAFLEESVRQSNPTMPVWRIPCGVPLPATCASPPRSGLRIAYVGRLIEYQKRISEVAGAFCRVARMMPDIECLIIGDGPERARIEALITAAGCTERVRVTGRMEPDALADLLAGCHVITLLSDYEGVPIALMEAMALGLVPVCLDTRSGIPELVRHGQTGLLLADRDGSFDAAIQRLAHDPAQWQQLTAGSRALIQASYSLAATQRQWLECLRAVASVRRERVSVPRVLRLPPPDPALHWGDRRPQPWHVRKRDGLRTGLRFKLGMLRQRLMPARPDDGS